MVCSLKTLLGSCVRGVGYEYAVSKAMHVQRHSHADVFPLAILEETMRRNTQLLD
jgi:hypothetical protein